MLGLCLYQGHGHRLASKGDLDTEHIVHATLWSSARPPFPDFKSACCLLTPNEVFSPSALVNRWVDELCPGVSFR
jgi:hypothetical protein